VSGYILIGGEGESKKCTSSRLPLNCGSLRACFQDLPCLACRSAPTGNGTLSTFACLVHLGQAAINGGSLEAEGRTGARLWWRKVPPAPGTSAVHQSLAVAPGGMSGLNLLADPFLLACVRRLAASLSAFGLNRPTRCFAHPRSGTDLPATPGTCTPTFFVSASSSSSRCGHS
jgi:hypothetical protein